jgi:hypothetical protein
LCALPVTLPMQRNNMKKIGIIIAVLLALFALLLVGIPALGVLYLQHQYAQQGPGYSLEINDWRANPFSGEFGLYGVKANGDQDANFERIYLNLDMGAFINGQLLIEDANLAGGKLDIEQTEQGLHIAGLLFSNAERDEMRSQSHSGRLADMLANNLSIENVSVQIETPELRTAFLIHNLMVPTLSRQQLRVFAAAGKTDIEYLMYEHEGHKLGFNTPWQTEFKLDVNGSSIRGDVNINNLQLLLDNLPSVNMEQLLVKGLVLSPTQQNAELIGISGLLIANEQDELVEAAEYSLLGVQHNAHTLILGQQDIRDFSATLHRNADGEINGLRQIMSSYQMLQQRSALQNLNATASADTQTANRPRVWQNDKITFTGNTQLKIIDDKLTQPAQNLLTLNSLTIGAYQSDDPQSQASITAQGTLDNTGSIQLQGQLGWHAQQANGQYQLEIQGINLKNLSAYPETYLAHQILQGSLNLSSQGTISQGVLTAQLNSEIPVIRLNPVAAGEQRINLRLSKAIDAVLTKGQQQEQHIKVYMQLNGPVSDADLPLLSVAKRLLRPALKNAAIVHNKLLSPDVITVTTLEGSDVQNLVLQPVEYSKGNMAVSAAQLPYLKQIGRLMQQKPALQLQLCGSAAQSENKKSPWQYMADTRAENIRFYLNKNFSIDTARLQVCAPKESKQTGKVELAF